MKQGEDNWGVGPLSGDLWSLWKGWKRLSPEENTIQYFFHVKNNSLPFWYHSQECNRSWIKTSGKSPTLNFQMLLLYHPLPSSLLGLPICIENAVPSKQICDCVRREKWLQLIGILYSLQLTLIWWCQPHLREEAFQTWVHKRGKQQNNLSAQRLHILSLKG